MSSSSSQRAMRQSELLTECLLRSSTKQQGDYKKLQTQIQNTIDLMRRKFRECEGNLQEIQTQWEKVRKFATTGPGFLNAKLEEIKSKTKNIQSVSTGIKETVGRVKVDKLIELPVEKVESLSLLFRTIYYVLYHKRMAEFSWGSFKQLALEFQNGEDFISRLVNVHFKDLKPQQYEAMLILKNDPQFDMTVVNSEYSQDIIDLADWVDYVCVGAKFSEEKKEAQKAYDKIRRDMHRREGTSVEGSKKFWKEALQQVDRFQMSLVSYGEEVRAFEIETETAVDNIKERIQQRQALIRG